MISIGYLTMTYENAIEVRGLTRTVVESKFFPSLKFKIFWVNCCKIARIKCNELLFRKIVFLIKEIKVERKRGCDWFISDCRLGKSETEKFIIFSPSRLPPLFLLPLRRETTIACGQGFATSFRHGEKLPFIPTTQFRQFCSILTTYPVLQQLLPQL